MVHQRQRLPLGFEAGDDLLGVHAQLDDLERHAAAHRFLLLGHVNHAAAAFADLLQQFVAANASGQASSGTSQFHLHRSFRSGRGFGKHTLRIVHVPRAKIRAAGAKLRLRHNRHQATLLVPSLVSPAPVETEVLRDSDSWLFASAFSFASAALISAHDGACRGLDGRGFAGELNSQCLSIFREFDVGHGAAREEERNHFLAGLQTP